MAYRILITETAHNEFQNLQSNNLEAIKKSLQKLQKYPYVGVELQGEMSSYRSLAVGRFRILFQVRKNDVFICALARRKNIYASLGRHLTNL